MGDLGFPGEFPYTRGIQPTMYRGRLWTMRQYAGFGTAAESNARYRYLLAQGVNGLSVAFDLPTQMGYDSDHPLAQGEVGRVGVAIDSIEDMAALFDGIPLDRVSTSMTINATAMILLALYIAVARRQGVAASKLSGTIQNDILKEYVARGTYIYPPRPSLRIVTDIFAFCERELPDWNTISISGYHIREAGSTAVQEVAFTFAHGIAYVQAAIDAGLDVNQFGQRLSFFFNAHNDFLEEIAKFRAARRLWATHHARPLRRDQSARAAASVSHADRGQHADRAAAGQQHRPRRPAGDGGGARRHAVAALQRPRRSARPADGRSGAAGAAHAADHRGGNRRGQHGRPGRWLVRDRATDRPDRSRRRRAARADRQDGRHARRRSRAVSSSARFRSPRIGRRWPSIRARRSSSASTGSSTTIRVSDPDQPCFRSIRRSSGSRSSGCGRSAPAATAPPGSKSIDAVATAARDGSNLVPRSSRGRSEGDGRRNRGRDALGVRRVPRDRALTASLQELDAERLHPLRPCSDVTHTLESTRSSTSPPAPRRRSTTSASRFGPARRSAWSANPAAANRSRRSRSCASCSRRDGSPAARSCSRDATC